MKQLKQGQTTILKNQRHISTAVARTLTYKQFYCALAVMFAVLIVFMSFGGKLIRGDYWFVPGKEHKLLVENTKLKETIKQTDWLRNSHFLFLSVTLDDPSYMKKNNGQPWEFFLEHSNRDRMQGFINIVKDGCHPHLLSWYKELNKPPPHHALLHTDNKTSW